MYPGPGAEDKPRWEREPSGGDEGEAEERGRQTNLQQTCLYGGAGLGASKVEPEEADDEPPGLRESAGRVFPDVLSSQREEDSEASARRLSPLAALV